MPTIAKEATLDYRSTIREAKSKSWDEFLNELQDSSKSTTEL